MNFKEAYEEMLKGKKVRRKNWEDYKYYTLNENDIYFVDKLIVSNITVEDALAKDWEVVEKSKVWKPKEREPYYYVDRAVKCPRCNHIFIYEYEAKTFDYCPHCGQHLNWSNEN